VFVVSVVVVFEFVFVVLEVAVFVVFVQVVFVLMWIEAAGIVHMFDIAEIEKTVSKQALGIVVVAGLVEMLVDTVAAIVGGADVAVKIVALLRLEALGIVEVELCLGFVSRVEMATAEIRFVVFVVVVVVVFVVGCVFVVVFESEFASLVVFVVGLVVEFVVGSVVPAVVSPLLVRVALLRRVSWGVDRLAT
jgi:hypothetical protein